jgi:hypothetical protein
MTLKTFEHAVCLGFGSKRFKPDITIGPTALLSQGKFQSVAAAVGQLVLLMFPQV